MSPLDDATKAGAGQTVALILASLAALGGGFLFAQGGWTQGEAAAGHVVIGWGDAGAAPAGAVVLHATVRASNDTALAFGVPGVDAGYQYFRCNVVALPVDGGRDPGPDLIPGSTIVYDDGQVDVPAAGAPQLECWAQGRADAPFPCACAIPDAGCLQPDAGDAPTGITLQPGAFVPSAGCRAKACVELAGSSSWMAECGP